ncbi:uncharacterized protein LOC129595960 [Paramacrobiotus metropolitanus]|uniref:uncharacterized protein LOC129595960 n=1 Tax=Paramacrobiotus metropolitanus TaxID=2943436 RepID=UPI002445B7D2|nr:uncharacterized protein LOC129595960 [Paramacrobiotus metropolitanus]
MIRTGHEELVEAADSAQAFCAATGRPDREVRISELSKDNLVLIRVSERATHVLMRATTVTIIEPLWCPLRFAENAVEACKKFRAGYPQDLKAHLEGGRRNLHSVQLNFHCPCPAEFNQGAPCDLVEFDPFGTVFSNHIRDQHPAYYAAMSEALCHRWKMITGQRHREFIRDKKNRIFPQWTGDVTRLWPRQVIPDKIVFPAVIKGSAVYYVCGVPPCAGHESAGPMDLHLHLLAAHRRLFRMPTKLFHGCPADARDCSVVTWAPDHQVEVHVKAVHPQLLGLTTDYLETAKQERARLERLAVETAECVGESLSRAVDTEDAAENEPFIFDYHCPVLGCRVEHHQRDYIVWHIGADHRDKWNNPVATGSQSLIVG